MPTRDLRLVLPAVALWLSCWTTVALGPWAAVVAAAAISAVGVVVLIKLPRHMALAPPAVLRVVALALACAVVGSLSMWLRLESLTSQPWPTLSASDAAVTLTGHVIDDPRPRDGAAWPGAGPASLVGVRIDRVVWKSQQWNVRAPVLVFAQGGEWLKVQPGEQIVFEGSLRRRPPDAPYAAFVFADSLDSQQQPAAWWRFADDLRSGLRDAAASRPPDVAGLMPALVVGDTSAMPPALVDDLRAAGLAHLTAVSGANITILLVACLLVARLAGVKGYALPVLGIVVVLAFVLVARPQPSVMRAVVMGSLGVIAVVASGRRIGLNLLLAATVLLLLADPWLSRSWGFALSVAATGGLLVLAPRWCDVLSRRMPRPLAEALAVTVAAQVTTLPLQLALAGTTSWAAVPANVLAGVAVAPATILGALAALASQVSAPLATDLAWFASWPVQWIVSVARWASAAPLPNITVRDGWHGALLALVLLGLAAGSVVVLRPFVARAPRPMQLAMLLAASALVFAWWQQQARWPPTGWVMVACDVGQGDALVLSTGPSSAMVVDTGPEPGAVDRCLRRLGVHVVSAVVITHDHADHADGLPGVLRDRDVGPVFVSPLDDPPENASAVHAEAAAAGLSVQPLTAGQSGSVGWVRWQVVWPAELIRGEGSDPNNASVVLLVQSQGVRLLLTGDVEQPAQAAMLAWATGHGIDLHADVLKVPHHGSANQDSRLADGVDPRVAVISVGADNTYGHPDPELVASLQSRGIPVERTDLDGDVAIVFTAGELRVVTR